jgi:hypothetical protein
MFFTTVVGMFIIFHPTKFTTNFWPVLSVIFIKSKAILRKILLFYYVQKINFKESLIPLKIVSPQLFRDSLLMLVPLPPDTLTHAQRRSEYW